MKKVYEFTKFSRQKTAAEKGLRASINAVISDMKRGHFSNEKNVTNGTNVLRSAGVQDATIRSNPAVREVRVTQSVRIFFFEANNAIGESIINLVCMGHMDGSQVSFDP